MKYPRKKTGDIVSACDFEALRKDSKKILEGFKRKFPAHDFSDVEKAFSMIPEAKPYNPWFPESGMLVTPDHHNKHVDFMKTLIDKIKEIVDRIVRESPTGIEYASEVQDEVKDVRDFIHSIYYVFEGQYISHNDFNLRAEAMEKLWSLLDKIKVKVWGVWIIEKYSAIPPSMVKKIVEAYSIMAPTLRKILAESYSIPSIPSMVQKISETYSIPPIPSMTQKISEAYSIPPEPSMSQILLEQYSIPPEPSMTQILLEDYSATPPNMSQIFSEDYSATPPSMSQIFLEQYSA